MEEQEITTQERLELIQLELAEIKAGGGDISKISDGWHSFEELYEFRKVYNAALFNEWAKFKSIVLDKSAEAYTGHVNTFYESVSAPKYNVHKSWRHYDGELCFGGGWFIVCAKLPTGLISNHYKAEDWDLFKIPEVEKSLFEFDGHTSQDVLTRLSHV